MTSREGATVARTLDAPLEAVALVLADPRSYDGVVVGSRRIRWFDPRWPDPGSRFHHTLGFGPVTLRDFSEVVEDDLPRSLRLLVHLRPIGSAEVVFRLEADGSARTHAEMTETPVSGLLAATWSPPAVALTRRRNDRVLARLGEVAAGRAEVMARGGASGGGRQGTSGRPAMSADAGRQPGSGGRATGDT